MACEKCGATPDVPTSARVIVTAAHRYMLDKMRLCYAQVVPLKSAENWVELHTDIHHFLSGCNAHLKFTETELKSIVLLPLEDQENLSPQVLHRAKTFDYWLSLYQATDLKHVLDTGSLVTHFQPIADMQSGAIVAYECLSRGIKPDGSLYPPHQMFEAARRTEMIYNLDRQCRLAALSNASAAGIEQRVFINFTPSAIYNPEYCLADTVKTALDLNINPSQIVFEVVESDRIDSVDHLREIFDYYKAKGFKIALDDVGSGYSSLNMIAKLKPEIIKIDMDLIRGIHRDSARQVIVQSLVNISREIGAQVLAEGVETEDELEAVRGMGIDFVQGYLIGRPAAKPLAAQP